MDVFPSEPSREDKKDFLLMHVDTCILDGTGLYLGEGEVPEGVNLRHMDTVDLNEMNRLCLGLNEDLAGPQAFLHIVNKDLWN